MDAADPIKQQYHTMIPTSDDRMTDGGGWRYHERGDDARNERLIKWKGKLFFSFSALCSSLHTCMCDVRCGGGGVLLFYNREKFYVY